MGVGSDEGTRHLAAMKPFLLLFLLAATLHAQSAPPPTPSAGATAINSNQPLFRCTLPGGIYEVAVRSIVAVASHEYLVDGTVRVTEVNIDTTGSLLARFYFIEPAIPTTPGGVGAAVTEKAQQLFQEAATRTDAEVWKKVVKNYPTTTHARTVEYRVADKAQLTKIYTAVEEAFRLVKTVTLKVD